MDNVNDSSYTSSLAVVCLICIVGQESINDLVYKHRHENCHHYSNLGIDKSPEERESDDCD
jgi:hypothetical protein